MAKHLEQVKDEVAKELMLIDETLKAAIAWSQNMSPGNPGGAGEKAAEKAAEKTRAAKVHAEHLKEAIEDLFARIGPGGEPAAQGASSAAAARPPAVPPSPPPVAEQRSQSPSESSLGSGWETVSVPPVVEGLPEGLPTTMWQTKMQPEEWIAWAKENELVTDPCNASQQFVNCPYGEEGAEAWPFCLLCKRWAADTHMNCERHKKGCKAPKKYLNYLRRNQAW